MAEAKSGQTQASLLGQFLMSTTVSQACMIGTSLHPLGEYDEGVVNQILENNWDTEEQMVSNLLLCSFLIPERLQEQFILKGLVRPAHPYYSIAAAAGSQSVPKLLQNSDELLSALRKATFSEHGLVSLRAFVALEQYLSYPKDVDFFTDILKKHNSPLFRNSVLWLLLNIKDRNEIKNMVESEKLSPKGKEKASRIIDEYFADMDAGKQPDLASEMLNFIPSFEDFDAMLDKEETLSEFFVDIDTNRDGKVSVDEIASFLEDIGKKIDAEKLRSEIASLETDCHGELDKDDFIELMFPKFQVV